MTALFPIFRKAAGFCAVFGFIAPLAAQPHLEWSRSYALNRTRTNQPLSLVVAPDNSIVVAGSSGNLNGDLDYVAIKYAPNGDQQWLRRFDDAGANDVVRRQAIDTQGNVIITGTSKTVSYDLAGNQLWAESYAGRDLAVDADFVYITGFSAVDYATAKLRGSNGTNVWTRLWNSQYNRTDVAQVLTVDTNGNVYVAGSVTWTCDRLGCRELLTTLKYGPTGNLITSRDSSFLNAGGHSGINLPRILYDGMGRVYTTGNDPYRHFFFWTYAYTLQLEEVGWWWVLDTDDEGNVIGAERDATCDSQGNLFLTGRIQNTAAGTKITTVKLKPDGHKAWRTDYGGSIVAPHEGMAVTQDAVGNTYVAGYGPEANGNDFLILKYEKDGIQKWVHRYDGPSHGNDIATDIALDRDGNIYVTGFSATAEGGSEFVTIKFSQLPKVEKQPSGAMRIQFITDPDADYILQGTTDFTDWTNLLTKTADATGFVEFEDEEAAIIPYRFYRGQTTPP